MGYDTRRGGADLEVKTKDSLDESSDFDELGDDELEPAMTDSEDEAAMVPSPWDAAAPMDLTAESSLRACKTLGELSDVAVKAFKAGMTFGDMAKHLLDFMCHAPTPLGCFSRQWCYPTQPTPGALPTHQRRGDILPIAPWLITPELEGVTKANCLWVGVVVVILDFSIIAQAGVNRSGCRWTRYSPPIKRQPSNPWQRW